MRRGERPPVGPRDDERAWLHRLAPAAAHLSTLAWAGARNSARGQQLFRDGAVGRLSARDQGLQVLVQSAADGDGDLGAESVLLTLQDAALVSDCSCGAPR